MDKILPNTYRLLCNLFDDYERTILSEIENELRKNPINYDLKILWKLDRSIGGIGAYSMPADPVLNPMPGGIGRTIYRPLQYARENMEISNINHNSRYVIQNVGLHLEGLVKYVIRQERIIKITPSSKVTLGQAIRKLNPNKYEKKYFDNLTDILELYNLSKHGLNNDKKRQRTFTPMDAIIFYLSSRKIGNKLLENHLKDLYKEIDKYIDRLIINRIESTIT